MQGVGFRHFTRRTAQRLGITGYAKNLRDGRVEVYAIGHRDQLKVLRQKLDEGPPSALVWEVKEEPAQMLPRYGEAFSIEHES